MGPRPHAARGPAMRDLIQVVSFLLAWWELCAALWIVTFQKDRKNIPYKLSIVLAADVD